MCSFDMTIIVTVTEGAIHTAAVVSLRLLSLINKNSTARYDEEMRVTCTIAHAYSPIGQIGHLCKVHLPIHGEFAILNCIIEEMLVHQIRELILHWQADLIDEIV